MHKNEQKQAQPLTNVLNEETIGYRNTSCSLPIKSNVMLKNIFTFHVISLSQPTSTGVNFFAGTYAKYFFEQQEQPFSEKLCIDLFFQEVGKPMTNDVGEWVENEPKNGTNYTHLDGTNMNI